MSIKCTRCGGTGKTLTHNEVRNMRVARKRTLAEVSSKMGISIGYLSDLESGRRPMEAELEKSFRKALK